MRSIELQRLLDEDWVGSGRKTASPSGTYDLELEPETFPNVLYWTTSIVDNKPRMSVEESREFGVHYGLYVGHQFISQSWLSPVLTLQAWYRIVGTHITYIRRQRNGHHPRSLCDSKGNELQLLRRYHR